MIQKQRGVEKLKEHRKQWKKDMLKEEKKEDAKESNEMGVVRHARKKKEHR